MSNSTFKFVQTNMKHLLYNPRKNIRLYFYEWRHAVEHDYLKYSGFEAIQIIKGN